MAESIHVIYAAHEPSDSAGIRTCPPTAEGLQASLDDCDQGALLAIGGDAFAPPVSWRAWVRELPRYRPGLGDAVRQALIERGHPGAALVAVEGAVEAGRIVLVAPDDAAVRDASLGVLSELSGASRISVPAFDAESHVPVPYREALLDEDSEGPASWEDTPETIAPRTARVGLATAAPEAAAAPAVPGTTGWRRVTEELGWHVDPNRWGELPHALTRMAPVRQVLAAAGERRRVVAPDGVERVVCGFPDLQRPESKVVSVAVVADLDGQDSLELLALHRHPSPTGTCAPAGTWTPASDLLPGPVCVTRTGRAPAIGGDLFAVDGRTVYLKRGRAVVEWDGREERAMGSTSQALASLVLRWSQR